MASSVFGEGIFYRKVSVDFFWVFDVFLTQKRRWLRLDGLSVLIFSV